MLARIGNLELVARVGRRRLHQRPAPLAVLRRVGGLRRAPRLRAGRRHPPRRLARVRAHRPVLHQGVRGRLERELLGAARRLEVDGVRRSGITKLDYAKTLAACLTYLVHHAARPRRPRRPSTTTSSSTCRRRRSTWTSCCTRSIGRRPSGPGDLRAPLQEAGGALRPPRHPRPHLRLLRGAGRRSSRRSRRCGSAATTSSCFTCSIRRRSTSRSPSRRASRISRAASRFRSCPTRSREQYRALVQAHIDALPTRASAQPHRLHAAQHVEAARSRAVPVPVDARTNGADEVTDVVPDAALPARARRPSPFRCSIHLTSASGSTVVAVPVADVPAARFRTSRCGGGGSATGCCWRCGWRRWR